MTIKKRGKKLWLSKEALAFRTGACRYEQISEEDWSFKINSVLHMWFVSINEFDNRADITRPFTPRQDQDINSRFSLCFKLVTGRKTSFSSNSPLFPPYICCDYSFKNLCWVKQYDYPLMIFYYLLITYLVSNGIIPESLNTLYFAHYFPFCV